MGAGLFKDAVIQQMVNEREQIELLDAYYNRDRRALRKIAWRVERQRRPPISGNA